jgi:hypothetical protein
MPSSQSMFDPSATLTNPHPGLLDTQTLAAAGPIGEDEEERVVHVFVTIQQTAKDRGEDGDAIAIAKVLCDPVTVHAKDTTAKWHATMSVPPNPTHFGLGFATGTALAVEYSEHPVGFETYIWTERIELV